MINSNILINYLFLTLLIYIIYILKNNVLLLRILSTRNLF